MKTVTVTVRKTTENEIYTFPFDRLILLKRIHPSDGSGVKLAEYRFGIIGVCAQGGETDWERIGHKEYHRLIDLINGIPQEVRNG